ncbi:pre-toxin TG domain-containing protein, partial [Bacillus altitudinis]|uniref:pre-toxin TG domain-containing protein n=1 Tax=Bacillus altitudinis TaxID=293387 RepID=UPI003879D986
KQTSEYLKIKKDQEEARKIAKEQEALANRPWYEKALDYGGNIVNELTGVNDAKRAATGVDPITGEELTAGQRVAAGGMAAAGYIPIVGWAGRIFKGGKAVYKTTQATSAAVRAVDIYKTSQKSFDALKTSQKGLYGLTATNGFSEAITGRDMFGYKVSKEQQEASMNAALGMLLPFGAKGFHGKIGMKDITGRGGFKHKYSDNSKNHLIRPEGVSKTGVSGGHNEKEFFNYLNEKEIPYKLERKERHPSVHGINDVYYKIAKQERGMYTKEFKASTHKKTVYDDNVFTDEQIYKYGQEAMENGTEYVTRGGQHVIQGTSNGLKFEGWKNPKTGEIESLYPVLEWKKYSN